MELLKALVFLLIFALGYSCKDAVQEDAPPPQEATAPKAKDGVGVPLTDAPVPEAPSSAPLPEAAPPPPISAPKPEPRSLEDLGYGRGHGRQGSVGAAGGSAPETDTVVRQNLKIKDEKPDLLVSSLTPITITESDKKILSIEFNREFQAACRIKSVPYPSIRVALFSQTSKPDVVINSKALIFDSEIGVGASVNGKISLIEGKGNIELSGNFANANIDADAIFPDDSAMKLHSEPLRLKLWKISMSTQVGIDQDISQYLPEELKKSSQISALVGMIKSKISGSASFNYKGWLIEETMPGTGGKESMFAQMVRQKILDKWIANIKEFE